MADPNAFPNKDTEDLDAKIDQKIKNVLSKIDWDKIDISIDEKLKGVDEKLKSLGLIDPDLLSEEDRKYVNTLPADYKNKALRYLDIFRDNPEVVSEYLTTLKQFGNEKDAKEAGATNILFYPSKILAHLSKNPEKFSEETVTRQAAFDLQGTLAYDLAYREDDLSKKIQKEHYGKFSTKVVSGLVEPAWDTVRSISKVISMVADKVGPENTASAVDWIESNWPTADDITYPNKDRPFDQDSRIQSLITDLAQFGIDIYTGGRLVKIFGWGAKKIAPGMFKKITNYVTKGKPAKTKAGKEIADSFGNIKYASSIAQKMGGWGLPVGIKYGLGRTLTSETTPGEEHATTFTQGFGFMPTLNREQWNKMTKRERASYSLKQKLIHGAEGTVLISGLTKAIGVGGKAIWGGVKWGGKTIAGPAETLVFNPIAKLAAATTVRQLPLIGKLPLGKLGEVPIGGIPLLVKAIRKGGGFISSKVLRIPPYKNWAYMSTTQGPLIERIFAKIEASVLPPLRVRGPWTKEAKEIFLAGQQKVARYKKSVGLMITQIDRSIYDMLGKGFGNRAFFIRFKTSLKNTV